MRTLYIAFYLLTNNFDQASDEHEKTLAVQIKEQQERVKAAAPDEKELNELQKKVEAHKKGDINDIYLI